MVGGLSIGLIVAAFASPRIEVFIMRRGGRPVLAGAAILIAAGHVGLGLSPALPICLTRWVLLGPGIGCGLYDPAVATLGRLYGTEVRPAIATLTLWGGFASTVCWLLSAFLVEHVG